MPLVTLTLQRARPREFTTAVLDSVHRALVTAGVPEAFVSQFPVTGDALNQLTGVGDLGAAILAQVPPAFQAQVEPLIPAIVEGIHGAFSLAVGQTFWLGVLGSIIAVVAAVAIKELPLRASNAAPVPTGAAQRVSATGTDAAPVQRNAQPSLD